MHLKGWKTTTAKYGKYNTLQDNQRKNGMNCLFFGWRSCDEVVNARGIDRLCRTEAAVLEWKGGRKGVEL